MQSFEQRAKELLQSLEGLPTVPDVMLKVNREIGSPSATARSLAAIIRNDPSLVAAVLRVANSPIYRGRYAETTSIQNAVARLGFKEVGRIVTSVSLIRTFEGLGSGIDHKAFWYHSVTTGIATGIFRRYSTRKQEMETIEAESAFVAGLLHDIGILLMDQYFPEELALVKSTASKLHIPLAQAERAALDTDHGRIGAMLLRRWSIPEEVVSAVAWHHDPDLAPPEHRRIAQVVHLADFICVNQAIGDTGEGLYEGFSEGAWHDLGLSVSDVESMLEEVRAEADRSEVIATV